MEGAERGAGEEEGVEALGGVEGVGEEAEGAGVGEEGASVEGEEEGREVREISLFALLLDLSLGVENWNSCDGSASAGCFCL